MKSKNLNSLKVALVYDKINTWGGAERVLLALHEIFPEAPLYTSVYNSATADWAKVFPEIITSFIQRFPFAPANSHWYCQFMPLAFESHNFDQYDIVISITSGEAKGIITKPKTLHLCYCLTPTRYLWSDPGYNTYSNFGKLNKIIHLIKAPLLHCLRLWDQTVATRPDYYATTSHTVNKRIQKYYHRESQIISPPVNTNFFKPVTKNQKSKTKNYFLVVSRLTAYKKIDLTVKACLQLNLPLKIAGTGPEYNNLKYMISHTPASNIQLLGKITDQQLFELYQNCLALIVPQEEDFGIVTIEAQSCGKPVIAFNKGGSTETVINHKTGIFFNHQTPESLIETIKKFNSRKFNSANCRNNALKFSQQKFQTEFKKWIKQKYSEYKI